MEKNLIIGTAGHIDHGKTTLIKALTGDDTDRLAEEKERGISIDLGFSHLNLGEELNLGIIDVPGHEKFIKNMLAGAGGVDIALLVVAADEGVMAQTKEHLAILELLDIKAGVVAVTKTDQVEAEWLDLVIDDTKEELADTFLTEAEVIPVSAIEGEGLVELKQELRKLAQEIGPKDKQAMTYLPVDRAFSVSGIGTVITGTLLEGSIEIGDKLQLYPSEEIVEVRGIEVHGKQVEEALPGQRVGLNLSDIATNEIERGYILAPVGMMEVTDVVDARLELLETAPLVLEHGDPIRFHIGAREIIGRVFLLDCKDLKPGEKALAQFKLAEPLVARYNEKYVLRRYSPMLTIGGGQIIEPASYKKQRLIKENTKELKIKESSDKLSRLAYILELESKQALRTKELAKRSSLAIKQVEDLLLKLEDESRVLGFNQKKVWLSRKNFSKLKTEVEELLTDYHQKYPLRDGMAKEELRNKLSIKLDKLAFPEFLQLLEPELITDLNAVIQLSDFKVEFKEETAQLKDEIINSYQNNLFTPPSYSELVADLTAKEELVSEVLNYLARQNELIKLGEELYFHQQAVSKARERLIKALKEKGSIETGEYRDLLASTRKYTIPLLEYFDAQGITKRSDNQRVLR